MFTLKIEKYQWNSISGLKMVLDGVNFDKLGKFLKGFVVNFTVDMDLSFERDFISNIKR